MKQVGLVFMTLVLGTLPCAYAQTTPESETWSLPQETSGRFIRPLPTHVVVGERICFVGKSRHVAVHFLLAPIAESHRFVAIAERKPLGNLFELNPCSAPFDYGRIPAAGRIPALKDLTPEQADQIFGSTTGAEPLTKRYKLVSSDGEEFLLNMVFENNTLKTYRISEVSFERLDKLSEAQLPNWHELNN